MHKLNVRSLEGKDAYLISTNQTVLVVDRAFVLEHGGPPRGETINDLGTEPIHEFVSVEIGDQFHTLKNMGSVPAGTVVMTGDGSLLKFAGSMWMDLEFKTRVTEGYNISVVRVGCHND